MTTCTFKCIPVCAEALSSRHRSTTFRCFYTSNYRKEVRGGISTIFFPLVISCFFPWQYCRIHSLCFSMTSTTNGNPRSRRRASCHSRVGKASLVHSIVLPTDVHMCTSQQCVKTWNLFQGFEKQPVSASHYVSVSAAIADTRTNRTWFRVSSPGQYSARSTTAPIST